MVNDYLLNKAIVELRYHLEKTEGVMTAVDEKIHTLEKLYNDLVWNLQSLIPR